MRNISIKKTESPRKGGGGEYDVNVVATSHNYVLKKRDNDWLLKEESKNELLKLASSWLSIALPMIALSAIILLLKDDSKTNDEVWNRGLEDNNNEQQQGGQQEEYAVDDNYDIYTEDSIPLTPLQSSDYVGFFCATIGLMIAAGGGIGGGGILVPIYILVMGFSPKHAIPLSNITVFGGAVANTILNAPKRHPLADRPLVDWDLILVMEPLTIGGALVGAFLNKILPDEFIVVALVILLSFTAYKSLNKAIKMYRLETLHMNRQKAQYKQQYTELSELDKNRDQEHNMTSNQEQQEAVHSAGRPLMLEGAEEETLNSAAFLGDHCGATVDDQREANELNNEEDKEATLGKILEEERLTPMTNITMLVSLFVVVLFINIMKGGGAFQSPIGIVCGSPSFWASNILMLVWILLVSFRARSYLIQRYFIKEKVNYKYVEGDIEWDPQATILYPSLCMVAGFFAGMFGIGGGIVKGPLMLAMGVHPKVSSASSACMILFTSFTATTSFVVFGLLQYDYAVVCVILGFCATIVGQLGLGYLMKKNQRNSMIAFSIGSVVLLSAILMTIQSLVSLAEARTNPLSYNSASGGGVC
eukprot:CAMPEP_0194149082 /NCGR_PEP_ID=MMETSP0152-20130528/36167_1 /TAXON_ID=1049557 /ORGANISM="Thalassiothrix antarctica, Strain L6-D1" /LENGTH=588 /DNA_ID=CAMNT_0038851031 /DNA_START=244 /DNA_END=2010 /DNA_ORIENTATION=+